MQEFCKNSQQFFRPAAFHAGGAARFRRRPMRRGPNTVCFPYVSCPKLNKNERPVLRSFLCPYLRCLFLRRPRHSPTVRPSGPFTGRENRCPRAACSSPGTCRLNVYRNQSLKPEAAHSVNILFYERDQAVERLEAVFQIKFFRRKTSFGI